jgi:hypothetical protein
MADAMRAAFSYGNAAPFIVWGTTDHVMVELLFIAQALRTPIQAFTRRWYCRGLFRATRGARRCGECTRS